ncbi:MAG: DUF2190 family protein [Rhodobacteraceae bacterium]|nr:DUF2190 family protein [Paracoccaceae bacterium]
MKTYHQPGNSIAVTAPADVSSGDGVLVGNLFGVAGHDALTGASVEIHRTGVFTMPKLEAQAWAPGDKVYWDSTNGWLTTVATGNKLVGAALQTAANPSTTGVALLDGAVR